jgi:DNA-directed RNA polymerase specialized sigma24 family protein
VSREVTQEKFATFLAWLGPETESAGEEYERLLFRLNLFFTRRGCRFPEELADETINRVILKLGEERIENRMAYCYGVAKNVYRESLRSERRRAELDEAALAAAPTTAEEPGLWRECLDRCLAELPAEGRELLLRYFSAEGLPKVEMHRGIAESLKLTQAALRERVHRFKKRVTVCVRACMG